MVWFICWACGYAPLRINHGQTERRFPEELQACLCRHWSPNKFRNRLRGCIINLPISPTPFPKRCSLCWWIELVSYCYTSVHSTSNPPAMSRPPPPKNQNDRMAKVDCWIKRFLSADCVHKVRISLDKCSGPQCWQLPFCMAADWPYGCASAVGVGSRSVRLLHNHNP